MLGLAMLGLAMLGLAMLGLSSLARAGWRAMNYRHAFHAGNFADVVKHVALARILVHLHGKPAAFRVIDTHAGAGVYDLAGEEASRSGEWRAGIGRLLAAPISPAVQALLKPYLDVVASLNGTSTTGLISARAGIQSDDPNGDDPSRNDPSRNDPSRNDPSRNDPSGNERIGRASRECESVLTVYPGSPALARAFLRPQDRLVACELEPKAYALLAHNLERDRRIKTVAIDGWMALSAYVPPLERRGIIVVDPPFEEAQDFTRLAHGLETAHRKWATGIYLLWYPIKGRQEPDALARRLKRSGIGRILRAEFAVDATPTEGPLGGCGLIIVNPPWTFENELATILPELVKAVGSRNSNYRLDWIAGEN
jgi:23S rRNA (adenine2030-N6)-methyltransferase